MEFASFPEEFTVAVKMRGCSLVDLYLAVPVQDAVLHNGRLKYILSVSEHCICIRAMLIDMIC